MLAWMIYAIVVSLLLGLAALAFERSAHLRLRPTRWLWGASIIASLLFPLAISSISFQIPTLAGIAPSAAAQKNYRTPPDDHGGVLALDLAARQYRNRRRLPGHVAGTRVACRFRIAVPSALCERCTSLLAGATVGTG